MLIDYAESADTSKAVVTIINVFSYGFIVLIRSLPPPTRDNTISTNIMLRRGSSPCCARA